MNFAKFIIYVLVIIGILIIFAYAGAITFPALPSAGSILSTSPLAFIFLLLSIIVLTLVGYLLGRGIRSIKSSGEVLGLTYMSALIMGGILALLTFLNFPYSAHVNFYWLGREWYDPWLTVFIIGAPIMLAFVV